jgi:isocitrate dehydrogenase
MVYLIHTVRTVIFRHNSRDEYRRVEITIEKYRDEGRKKEMNAKRLNEDRKV